MNRLAPSVSACYLILLVCFSPWLAAAEDIADAEASFTYISSTLQTFRATGRQADYPGFDSSDMEDFVALLDESYLRFSRDFNSESAMCRFYRDPENGRMTIEERAELSFSFLRDPDARVTRFLAANAKFKSSIEERFGRIVLDNINARKLESLSNQWLPSSAFDEAAKINFLDSMCT